MMLGRPTAPLSVWPFRSPRRGRWPTGPNLDVREVSTSDSAFVIVFPLPHGATTIADVGTDQILTVLFSPAGKYGAYGGVDDSTIKASTIVGLKTATGKDQPYRRFALKFTPLTYNQNTVERRALISATAVGGSCFVMVAGCLATRYKKEEEDLRGVQESFRASSTGRAAPAAVVEDVEAYARRISGDATK